MRGRCVALSASDLFCDGITRESGVREVLLLTSMLTSNCRQM